MKFFKINMAIIVGLIMSVSLFQPSVNAMSLGDRVEFMAPASFLASQKKLRIHSSSQAGQMVKNQYGGKVLKVSKKGKNGQVIYMVKLLRDNGDVISVVVDATSGRASRR